MTKNSFVVLETIDIFCNKDIDERIYLTTVNTKTNDILLKCVDDLYNEERNNIIQVGDELLQK